MITNNNTKFSNFALNFPYDAVTNWIDQYLLRNPKGAHAEIITWWLDKVQLWVRSRGVSNTVLIIKAMRLHTTRYLCGQALLDPAHPSIGLNSKGLPKKLGKLQRLLDTGNPKDVQLALTLLSITRSMDCPPLKPDLQLIEDPGVRVNPALLQDYIDLIDDMGLGIEVPDWSVSHYSTKSGPTGQAMMTSLQDAYNIPNDLLESIGVLGGTLLKERIELLRKYDRKEWNDKYDIRPGGSIRKLSVVPAPEGKSRIIAILDYWSQAALIPLHKEIFELLPRIKGDRTYDQTSFFSTLPTTGPYHSLDLSAATDRFPISLQQGILQHLIGADKAQAWANILTKYPFEVPWESNRTVIYGAGQPMGAYSSWAVFTLCHHLTVRLAARRAGKQIRWCQYALLGDDVVIADNDVAMEYRNIIKDLGVDISNAKSHVSDNMFEFAKRWVRDGVEVSGIPYKGLKADKWYLIAEELHSAAQRCEMEPHCLETGGIADLLNTLQLRRRQEFKIKKYLNLPRQSDKQDEREVKVRFFVETLFASSGLGCNVSGEVLHTFVMQTLAEVKTSSLEIAIKEAHKKIVTFSQGLNSLACVLPPGMDPQSLLMALPPVEASLAEINSMQDEFDKLRSAYYDKDEDIVFNKVVQIGIDPEKGFSRRNHVILQIAAAQIVNKYTMWAKAYLNTRRIELASSTSADPDLE